MLTFEVELHIEATGIPSDTLEDRPHSVTKRTRYEIVPRIGEEVYVSSEFVDDQTLLKVERIIHYSPESSGRGSPPWIIFKAPQAALILLLKEDCGWEDDRLF